MLASTVYTCAKRDRDPCPCKLIILLLGFPHWIAHMKDCRMFPN